MKQCIRFSSVAVAFGISVAFSMVAAAAAKTMVLDTAASSVAWKGSKSFVESVHHGKVGLASGTIEVEKNEIKGGKFVIDMTSITNEDLADNKEYQQKLLGHLSSDDFFAVKENPTATFEITSVKKGVEKGQKGTHTVSGKLTIRKKEEPVSFPATVSIKGDTAEADATIKIDRTKWGVTFNKEGSDLLETAAKVAKDKIIKNEIELSLKLVAKNEPAKK